MRLVVDSNILFATVIRRGKTLELIESDKLKLFSPSFSLGEVEEHRSEILKMSGFTSDELTLFIELLKDEIKFVPLKEYIKFLEKSMHLVPDSDDVDFFALALKLGCPVWSNDPHFKMQSEVRVFTTKELVEFLSKIK